MKDKKEDLKEEEKIQMKQEKKEQENLNETKNKKIDETQEKLKNTYEKKETNKKKLIIPIIILTVAICAILLFSVIFALLRIGNETILSGVTIMGVDVSDLSKEEAITKMQELVRKQRKRRHCFKI